MKLLPDKKPLPDEGLKSLLIAGEKAEKAFRFQETHFLFTSRRLIISLGAPDRPVPESITSIPYRSLVQFRLLRPSEDLAVLRLYVSGAEPGEYPLRADETLPALLTALSESLVSRQPLWLEKQLAQKRREAWRPLQMALVSTAVAMAASSLLKKRLKAKPVDKASLKQALRAELLRTLKPS